MNKEYIITKLDSEFNDGVWSRVTGLVIDCFPWDESGYRPYVKAFLCYDSEALHIRFIAEEEKITVKYRNYCDPVYKDSCVEFFLNPVPASSNMYMNFEINAVGCLLLGFGGGRETRRLMEEVDPVVFQIRSSVKKTEVEKYAGPEWIIEYVIPFVFLEKYFGKLELKSGMEIRANLYKCGDETAQPHFGCWNPIMLERPDFHRPEFFGKLVLG